MKRVVVQELLPGMVLVKPVTNTNGLSIVAAGTALDAAMIERLQRTEVTSVYVEGDAADSGGKTLMELEAELDHRFRHVAQDPIQQMILRDILVKGLACGISGDDIIPPLSKPAWDMVGLDEHSLNECIERGDDFVFMSRPDSIDAICQTIIKRFDLVIPDFYDRDDRLKGFIDSVDRRGNKEQFTIMSLSIAVITNERVPIAHPGDVSKIASELKKRAKALQGSVYVKDERGRGINAFSATADSTAQLPACD